MLNAKKIKVNFEKGKMKITRRAEIALRFDVPEEDATQDYLDALVGGMKQDLKQDFGKHALEIEGSWL